MLGIPESSSELGNQFPLNMHLHYLNGVSFSKGCYIGQELTQRTFHTGVIRRMALPFILVSKHEDIAQDLKIDASNFMPMQHVDKSFDMELKSEEIRFGGTKIGKVLANKFNCGVALIDINKLDKIGANAEYRLDEYRVLIWQPTWLDMVHSKKIPDEDMEEPLESEGLKPISEM
jgi:folate-binding protein YgfZ